MTALAAFIRLSRPLFLYGGFAGVALGAAIAARSGRRLDVATYLWAQALVSAFHLMVHYANDYFDRQGDVAARRTAWWGGCGVLPAGTLPARTALIAAIVCAALGLAATVRFALAGNGVVAALGIAILVFAWCYSAPPVRLAARGLGEIDTVLVVAVLVPCVGYAAFSGTVDLAVLAALAGPAAAIFAMMLSVELPDSGSDLGAGKRTLAVRWGPAATWSAISTAAALGAAIAGAQALKVAGVTGGTAMLPAAVAAFALVRAQRGDPRPASMAFWGVALYATTISGLAAAYALAR
ncbi:MAG: hypothetical protein NVS3B7_13820 [Candidatus Elarobacter sp.]